MLMRSWLLSLPTLFQGVSGRVFDLPGVYGPIAPVPNGKTVDPTCYLKSRPSEFVHPGIWMTHDDLEQMRQGVISNQEPWASTFANFSRDQFSQANYTMSGPYPYLSRGTISNYTSFTNDTLAAWQNALMWYITKDEAHWNRSTTILDAWGTSLVDIVGTDRSLLVGLDGDMFVNAAEIMRWEGNWTEQGASWAGGSGFSNQLYWLFLQQSVVVGQANYGTISIKALLSFSVYLGDVALYNYAINLYLNDPCASIFATYSPETGQSSEAGRDQVHAQGGMSTAALASRVAESQGTDLWSLGDNLLLKGAEYLAKFNQNGTVTYDPDWYRCEAVLVDGPWPNISYHNFGQTTSGWDLTYYTYVVKRGLSSPWLEKAHDRYTEGNPVNADGTTWGRLLWAVDRGAN